MGRGRQALSSIRTADLRHELEEEFVQAACGTRRGAGRRAQRGVPRVFALLDCEALHGKDDAWAWEYRGRHQDGAG